MENDAFPLKLGLLPFAIAIGILIGESIMAALIAPELPKNNDVAGAGAAITAVASFVGGFAISLVTIGVRALIKSKLPKRIGFRAAMSVVAGAIIGIFTWSPFAHWALAVPILLIAPVWLSWPWPKDDFYE